MDQNNYELSFQLISVAGDSKSESMCAIQEAAEGNFTKAKEHLELAESKMREAHQLQINLIQQEAGGAPVAVNIILVHAQDHLTMAMVTRDQAEQMVRLYQEIQTIKEKLK